MQVRDASRDERVRVLRATHGLWGGGLGLDNHLALNLAVMESPWGREHGRVLVGCDDLGNLAAALRLWWHPGALDGQPVRIARLDGVFTLPEVRGRGHAAQIVTGALARARAEGCHLALLMAEGGAGLWAGLGFRSLPASETACRTVLPAPWPREPPWAAAGDDPEARVPGLRPGLPGDLDGIADIHREEAAGQRLRLERGGGAWEQVFLERDLRRRFRGEEGPFWVIERQGRIAAYVLLEAAPPMLRWREHGVRRGAEDGLADLFWSALVWARRRRLQRIEGWRMPGALTLGPLYPASERRRKDRIPMLLPLHPGVAPPPYAREEDCRIFELDVS